MAIKSIGKIVFYESLDQGKITDMLSGSDTIVFEVERRYVGDSLSDLKGMVLPVSLDDVSIDYLQALKDFTDVSLWQHEQNAIVYKGVYNSIDKEFDFTGSYVRNQKDTSTTTGLS